MRIKIIFLLLTYILSLFFSAWASDSVYIAVRGKITENSVKLRWSASDASAWRRTNECGFRVERYTVKRNGQLLNQAEKKEISARIKAEPVNNWEQIANKNGYAAIIAQALYGESFSLNSQKQGTISQLVNISREQDQRFLTSMYAAEHNYEAACKAAWGMTDTEIQKGCSYVYRVYPADTVLCQGVSYGFVYLDASLQQDLPKVSFFKGNFGDKMVMLTWNVQDIKTTYTSFDIQKSEDGIKYKTISDLPLMNINDKDMVSFPDSLAQNYRKYYYRIRGVDSFGDYGPWSDVISGEGKELLNTVPVIVRSEVERDSVLVDWEFEARQEPLLSHFELLQSATDKGEYETIVTGISVRERHLSQLLKRTTNYLKIAAVGKDGTRMMSLPVLAQMVDSVPPMIPTGLSGEVDSTGVVTLRWNANTDEDILGYRLYRTDVEEGSLIMVNNEVIKGTVYTDTVNIKMLNNKVYYAISGLDKRYNQSEKSEVVALSKPDVIPPMTPSFTSYNSTNDGIVLHWLCATMDDVKTFTLKRIDSNGDSTIVVLPKDSMSYCDRQTKNGRKYKYTLVATDEGNNSSIESQPVTVKSVTMQKTDLSVKLQIEPGIGVWIIWKGKSESPFRYFEVYRVDSSGARKIKSLTGDATSYLDRDVKHGVEYTYFIKFHIVSETPEYTTPLKIKY